MKTIVWCETHSKPSGFPTIGSEVASPVPYIRLSAYKCKLIFKLEKYKLKCKCFTFTHNISASFSPLNGEYPSVILNENLHVTLSNVSVKRTNVDEIILHDSFITYSK